MGDIGSHWMDMIQHLTGLKITSLCADLQIFHTTRKKPKGAVETFTGKKLSPEDYSEIPIDTDDFGTVLLRIGNRARGNFSVSQMSAGCKNRFQFEIFGTKKGVSWNQERPDELWIGERNSPNQIIVKDGSLYLSRSGGVRRPPGRTQRRLRRRAQAGVSPVLPQGGGSERAGGLPDLRGRAVGHATAGEGAGEQRDPQLERHHRVGPVSGLR